MGTNAKKEASSAGWITVYPSLHENKEKGKLHAIHTQQCLKDFFMRKNPPF